MTQFISANTTLNFGKYKGKTPAYIVENYGAGYLAWLMANNFIVPDKQVNDWIRKWTLKNNDKWMGIVRNAKPTRQKAKEILKKETKVPLTGLAPQRSAMWGSW